MSRPVHPRVAAIADLLVGAGATGRVHELADGAHTAAAAAAQVAALLGVPRVERASAAFVREHTGQPIGGVAPVGHPAPIGTLVDVELARYDRVWAAAGHPSAVFPTSYDELLRLTAGTPAEVGSGPTADGPAAAPHPAAVGP
ncbi:YbaK/EbsC family protein [Geodermatophilus sp. SYSU D00525]